MGLTKYSARATSDSLCQNGSHIQPYFDYNDIFLENTTAKQYDKLTRLQKRCLRRCLPDNQKIDRDEIYNITGINKLQDRANAHLLKLMYKSAQAMPLP